LHQELTLGVLEFKATGALAYGI